MATVVVIHAADDTLPARALAEKVRQTKVDVVLEKTGDDLRDALKSATVAIALWSPRSNAAAELAEHAAFAKTSSTLIHATMQSAAPPEQFRGEPAVNLTGWRGEDDFPAWRELAKLVTDKAGLAPLPPPVPKPPSGFFQPGAVAASPEAQRPQTRLTPQPPRQPPPRPQAAAPQRATPQPSRPAVAEPEKEKKGGGMMLIAIIAVVVLALGGGAFWFMTQQAGQSAAYEDVDPNSADSLREFLAGDPSPADRERAQADLAALEQNMLDAAREANTIDAYEAFLRAFPNSSEAIYAQGQIQQLRLQEGGAPPAAAPEAPPVIETIPAETPPAPTPAPADSGPTQLTPPPVEEPETEEPPSAPPEN